MQPFHNDPTSILVENFTNSQKQAAKILKTGAKNSTDPRDRLLIVVPFRDRWDMTEVCLRSVLKQDLPGVKARLVLIDNGSIEPTTDQQLGRFATNELACSGIETDVFTLRIPFNFSTLINEAFKRSQDFNADWLFLLNNDVEILQKDAIFRLVTFGQSCPHLGAVGCSLVYPDGHIQHLFVAPGVMIVAAHPLKGIKLDLAQVWFREPRPVAAVTAAALLVSTKNFEAVGMLDERLPAHGQDVNLCLELQKLGLVNWVVPGVVMIHHECATRSCVLDRSQIKLMYENWGDFLTDNPYYSKRFSRWSERPAYTLGEGDYPWQYIVP